MDKNDNPLIPSEEQFRILAEKFQRQLDTLPQIAWTNKPDGEVDFYNKKWYGYTGLDFESTKGWGWKEVIFPDDLQYNLDFYSRILASGESGEFEIREKRTDGEFRWHLVRLEPVKGTDGKIEQWVGTATDIHELKSLNQELSQSNEEIGAANEELAAINEELTVSNEELSESQSEIKMLNLSLLESETRLREIINSAPVAMAVNRGDKLIFELVNDAMLNIIGKDRSIIGKPWFDAIPEVVGTPIIDILFDAYHTGEERKILEAPVTLVKQGVSVNGYYNVTYSPLKENGRISGIIQSVVDVTEQVTARNQLSRAYEQARLSKEAAELGTFDMDLKKGTLEWDTRCRLLFGISHQDTVTYEKDFLSGLHPEDLERVTAVIDNVFNKSISNGVYDVEYRTIGVEDQQLRWVRAKGQAYFDQRDRPVRFIGSVLDITEQKRDDQRKNDFIGMVSHELKTPLTTLNALLQVTHAKLKNSEDSFLKSAMDKANTQVKKMGNMINGFLNISRLESGKLHLNIEKFNLDEVLHEMISEIKITATKHQIEFQDCRSVVVDADKDKISHVISNLLSNAIKYSPNGLHIEVRCEVIGRKARVSIKDEGMGIKEKDREKLFTRYYRIESDHTQHISGFGIGLYLSAEIIHAHQGTIGVDSEPGIGSTFYFTLPITSSAF